MRKVLIDRENQISRKELPIYELLIQCLFLGLELWVAVKLRSHLSHSVGNRQFGTYMKRKDMSARDQYFKIRRYKRKNW